MEMNLDKPLQYITAGQNSVQFWLEHIKVTAC